MVTHDLAEAGWFGHEIILMRDGRIVQRGTLGALIEDPAEPFVTQFVSAQRQVLELAATGDSLMPGLAVLLALVLMIGNDPEPTVRVGSKMFTESVILGEIAQDVDPSRRGFPSSHRRELGGTQVLFHALEADRARRLSRVHWHDLG